MSRSLTILLIAGLGCSGEDPGTEERSSLEIEVITTSSLNPGPSQTIDVAVIVANHTETELRVVEQTLRIEPADAGFRFTVDATSPKTIAAGGRANLRLFATLPIVFDVITVDGDVLAVDEGEQQAYRARGARTPLVIDRTAVTPPDTDLVVSTVDDELDGATNVAGAGGAGDLSLREAIAIANSRPGPDVISFDATLFSPSATAVIQWDPSLGTLLFSDDGTRLDATDRGVIISGHDAWGPAVRITGSHTALVGVTIQDLACHGVRVLDAGSVLLERVHIAVTVSTSCEAIDIDNSPAFQLNDSLLTGGDKALEVDESDDLTLRGNTIEGGSSVLLMENGTGAAITDNSFDPTYNAIWLRGVVDATVSGNQFLATRRTVLYVQERSARVLIVDNSFVSCGTDAGYTLGCISVSSESEDITLSRNLIHASHDYRIGIAAGSNRDVAPPAISTVGATVTGTTSQPDDSIVELFSDSGDQADTFIGSATVTAGAWSMTPAEPLVSGHTVSATVTDLNGSSSELSLPTPVP